MMLSKQDLINTPSVLAVDDDVDNLCLIGYVLESMDLKCYGVDDSSSVLDLAVDKTPKLILVDIVMPKLSGFEVLKQLRANTVTRKIPVIAVTGLANFDRHAKIRNAGFDDYISKPFILEKLETLISKHLNHCSVEAA